MKAVKLGLIFAVAALMTLGFGSAAFAFHSGGVAHCDGCHTMHNSQDGVPYESHGHGGGGVVGTGHNSFLTVGNDPSSTCLNCHISIYQAMSSDGSVYSPGGDFWWVTQDTPGPRGSTNGASQKGHNTIAADFGILADDTLTSGPSNGTVTYQAAWLGCNSCHDPHGKKANNINPLPISGSGSYGDIAAVGSTLGNYRLLGGTGYDGGEQASGVSFAADAPIAVGLHTYRGSTVPTPAGQGWDERDNNHVDYGSGMSEWCANCHSGFTADSSLAHRHPASDGAHLNGFGATYDAYVSTGDLTGGNSDSYDRLVPFERGVTGVSTLDPASTNGPDSNSNVMCLTCHRAHAGAWNDALRWDPQEELLADSPLLTDPRGVHAYYGDDITVRYNEFQRSLCNKCHLQD